MLNQDGDTNRAEMILGRLDRYLLELRRAVVVLDDGATGVAAQLAPIHRAVHIGALLHDRYVVAIGGSQGAGKTHFLRSFLGVARQWLPDNAGRGERSPVLVTLRPDLTEPYAVIKEFSNSDDRSAIIERPVEADEFVAIVRQPPADNTVLPILYVPGGDQDIPQEYLLLPGYEDATDEWQALMRLCLAEASLAVIVVDKQLLASDAQAEILSDIRGHIATGRNPIVVISRTEQESEDQKDALRKKAALEFKPNEIGGRQLVVCVGSGADYIKAWRTHVGDALADAMPCAPEARQVQIQRLGALLGKIPLILENIQTTLNRKQDKEDIDSAEPERYLKILDDETGKIRDSYRRALSEAFKGRGQAAADSGVKDYISNEEGPKNKGKAAWRWAWTTSGEREAMFAKEIVSHWDAAAEKTDFGRILWEVTRKALGRLGQNVAVPHNSAQLLVGDGNVAADSPIVSEAVQENLVVLFRNTHEDAQKIAARKKTAATNKELEIAIKAVPSLALELVRIGVLYPEAVNVDRGSWMPQSTGDTDFLRGIHETFGAAQESVAAIVKNIAIVAGLEEGISDIPALMKAMGGSTAAVGAASTAMVASAMVAVGAIALAYAIRETQKYDARQRQAIRSAMYLIRDAHEEHYLAHFDALMANVRERLHENLRRRYHLSEWTYRRDRLVKAMRDVEVTRYDMLDVMQSA